MLILILLVASCIFTLASKTNSAVNIAAATKYIFDCREDYSVFPNLNDPRRFIICVKGKPRSKPCKKGDLFDVVHEKCGPSKGAKVARGTCPKEKTIALYVLKQNPVFFYLCVDGQLKFMLRCPYLRGNKQVYQGGVEGLFPTCRIPCARKKNVPAVLPTDFISCDGRFGHITQCPKGECFDPYNEVCTGSCLKTSNHLPKSRDHRLSSKHRTNVPPPMKDSIGWNGKTTSAECGGTSGDKYPDFRNCHRYFQCGPGKPGTKHCGSSKIFRSEESTCFKPPPGFSSPQSACPASPCRSGNVELATDPYSAGTAVLCIGDKVAYMKNCPAGRLGYKWVFRNTPVGKCLPECPAKGDFPFPDPELHGAGYLRCSNKGSPGSLMKCDQGKVFDTTSHECSSLKK